MWEVIWCEVEWENLSAVWFNLANAYRVLPHVLILTTIRCYSIPENIMKSLWSIMWSMDHSRPSHKSVLWAMSSAARFVSLAVTCAAQGVCLHKKLSAKLRCDKLREGSLCYDKFTVTQVYIVWRTIWATWTMHHKVAAKLGELSVCSVKSLLINCSDTFFHLWASCSSSRPQNSKAWGSFDRFNVHDLVIFSSYLRCRCAW